MTPEWEPLGSMGGAILGVALLLFAAWGLGALIVTQSAKAWSFGETVLMRMALGLNLVGWLGITLGMSGGLRGNRSVWMIGGLCLWSVVQAWREWTRRPNHHSFSPAVSLRRFSGSAGLAMATIFVTLGPALCEPTGWDELVYHNVLPRRWHQDGWPAFYPDLPYSGFPSLAEILDWLAAPIENLILPRLLVWTCWIIGLALGWRTLCRIIPESPSLLLITALAVSPALLMISANGYVEALLLMNIAALLFATNASADENDSVSPMVLGVLAGGAAAIKVTGLTLWPVLGLWAFVDARRRRDAERLSAWSGALSMAVAVAVASPFYLRPWLATGNPVYPYFAEWFTTNPEQIDVSRYHHAIGGDPFGLRSLATFIEAPILLAFNDQLYDGSLGWQFLGVLALGGVGLNAAARQSRGADLVWRAFVPLWLYVAWYFTAQQARFAAPAALAWTMLAGTGVRALSVRWQRPMLAMILVATVFSLPWPTANYYFASWATIVGSQTRTENLDDGTGGTYLPLLRTLRDRTPRDAHVLLLWEHRGLYLPRRSIVGTPFFREGGLWPPADYADARRVMEYLRANHITHLVAARHVQGPDRTLEWAERYGPLLYGIERCHQQGELELLWESDEYGVFAVRSIPSHPSEDPR